MAWTPISRTVPQYEDGNGVPYSGAVLKAYRAGTSTVIAIATDSSGATQVSSVALNASGYPTVSGNVVLPHLNEKYKLALYPNQDAADSNTGAIWTIPDISIAGELGSVTRSVSTTTALDSSDNNSVIDASGTITISLPDIDVVGGGFIVLIHSQGAVTIDGDGAETINGYANIVLNKDESAILVSGETSWTALAMRYGKTPDSGELTIASGVITVLGAYHTIDTESDASTDDLVTINGGVDGQALVLRQESISRVVTLKSSGNIYLSGAPQMTMFGLQTVTLIYDGSLSKWMLQSSPVFPEISSKREIYGLTISNNTTDADHDLDIASGDCWDSTRLAKMIVSASITKQMDSAFSEGSGVGGFASGESLPTSGTVHIWAIAKADGTTDIFGNNASTSGLSPTLPTGFVYKRRIGSWMTDASANLKALKMEGDIMTVNSPATSYSATISSEESANVPTPLNINVMARFNGSASRGSAIQSYAAVYGGDQTIVTLTSAAANIGGNQAPAASSLTAKAVSGVVKVNTAAASNTVTLTLMGWEDYTREKFA